MFPVLSTQSILPTLIKLLILLTFLPFALAGPPSENPDLPAGAVLEETPPPYVPPEPVKLRLNLPATRLDLFINGEWVRSYPVAIGTARYPTPIRDYNVSMIIWNPWWIPPDSDWAKDAEKTPPGPGNPLGVVKLILEDGIRIHGTNAPSSIGRASSHACLRMHNEDARDLAWAIQTRHSEKTDPELQDRYRRNRRQPYYVKLLAEVPVGVDYRLVERQGNRLLIHPNPYYRKGFQSDLKDALMDHPEIAIDQELIQQLKKQARRKTVEVPLDEIGGWVSYASQETPSTQVKTRQSLNPDAAKALQASP